MDMKPFDMLEQRIQRAARMLKELRRENKDLLKKVGSEDKTVESLRQNYNELKAEIKTLQKEKDQIRTRVEGILQGLDGLGLDEEG